MKNEVTYSLKGFYALLGDIAEEYHIRPCDVLLLIQSHTEECSKHFAQGEAYARTIDGKLTNEIMKELNEKSAEDNKNP